MKHIVEAVPVTLQVKHSLLRLHRTFVNNLHDFVVVKGIIWTIIFMQHCVRYIVIK